MRCPAIFAISANPHLQCQSSMSCNAPSPAIVQRSILSRFVSLHVEPSAMSLEPSVLSSSCDLLMSLFRRPPANKYQLFVADVSSSPCHVTLHERSLSRQAGPFCSGKERKRSFRSDEAKAEEPERTLFLPGAERSGLPSQCRPILSPPSAAKRLQHFLLKRLFCAVSETAEKDTLTLLASI